MQEESSFQNLMAQLRTGDADAATRIFELYAHRLVGLARKRLANIVKAKVDPEDIVQSAFRSFFRADAEGAFQFTDWNDLWNLLAVITLRKCGHRVEYFLAARRDAKRELARPKVDADSIANWQHIAREPTPSEAAILVETMEAVLASLNERQRSMLELSLQGAKPEEVSEKLHCSVRTVERTLQRVRKKLEELCGKW